MEKFDKNIVRRGSVPETFAKKGKSYPVGPVMLGFFVFVVIGSCNYYILFVNFNDFHFLVPDCANN